MNTTDTTYFNDEHDPDLYRVLLTRLQNAVNNESHLLTLSKQLSIRLTTLILKAQHVETDITELSGLIRQTRDIHLDQLIKSKENDAVNLWRAVRSDVRENKGDTNDASD